jgi:hypothetical protein
LGRNEWKKIKSVEKRNRGRYETDIERSNPQNTKENVFRKHDWLRVSA